MADQKLRYTIEVDPSKATPELRRFLAQFEATTRGIAGAEKRLDKSFAEFDKSISKVYKSLERVERSQASRAIEVQLPLWQRLAIGITGVNQALSLLDRTLGRVARALVAQFSGVANEAERLLNLSRRFDQPVEAIGRLDFVARRAGVSFEALGAGARLFAVQLAQARAGNEQAVRLFRALGIEGTALRDLAARGLVPAFLETAQRLSGVSDGATRAAIGARLFRGSWDALKIVLADTNGDIEGAAKRLDELRGVLPEELVRSASRMKNAFFDLGVATDGLFARLADAGLFDAVTRGINAMSDAIASIPDATVRELADALADVTNAVASMSADNLDSVVQGFAGIVRELERILNILRTTVGGATVGALIGTVIPGAGTLAGASVGALAGLAVGFVENRFTPPVGGESGPVGELEAGAAHAKGTLRDLRAMLRGTTTDANAAADAMGAFGTETDTAAKHAETYRDAIRQLDTQIAVLEGRLTREQADDDTFIARLAEQAKLGVAQLDALRDRLARIRELQRQRDVAVSLADPDAFVGPPTPRSVEAWNQQRLRDLERFRDGAFDIFEAIGSAADTMFDAIARGTLRMSEVFDSLKVGIIKSFVDAFKQGFAEKLGFENKFRINIAQFVKNIGGILTGKDGGGGLFGGVFGPQGPGGTTGTGSTTGGTPAGFSIGGLTGGQLAALVGSLVTIGLAAKSLADSARGIKDVGLGAQGESNAFKLTTGLASLASVGLGVGVGAAVGSIVPGIGTLVGAAVGGAVTAAISAAITSAISDAIQGATQGGIKRGLTQSAIDKEVATDPTIVALSAGISQVRGLGLRELLEQFTPSIEDIFDKLFRQLLGRAGLGSQAGQGIAELPRAIRAELNPLRGTAFQLARIASQLIGAGGNLGRSRDLSSTFLAAAGARAARTGEEVQEIIFRTFRAIFEGSFADAFRINRRLIGAGTRGTDALVRAFQPSSSTLDFRVIADTFTESAEARDGFFGRKAQKASREAVGQAIADGLSQGDFASFGLTLGNVVRDAFTKGITQAITQTPIGDLLGEAFQLSRQTSRRLRREGFTDDNLARVAGDFGGASERILTLLTAGGGGAFLQQIAEAFADAEKAIDLFSIAITAATGDFDDLKRAVESTIAEELAALREFRSFIDNAALRTAILSDNPFAALEAAREAAGRNLVTTIAGAPERFLLPSGTPASRIWDFLDLLAEFQDRIAEFAAAGSATPEWEALASMFEDGLPGFEDFASSLILFNDLPLSEQADIVRDLYESSLAYLEAEIELQNARIQFYGQAKKSFQDLIDQVSVIRFGRFGQRSIFDRLSAELPGLAADLQSEDESVRAAAITRLQEIGPQLLSLASSLFAPGSAAFTSFLNLLEPLLGEAFDVASVEEARAQELKDQAIAHATELQAVFGPVLADIELALEKQVGDRLIDIYNVLAGTGATGILGVLTAIATSNAIGVTFEPQGRALGGPVYGGTPYMVGERGPELFVPDTSGYIVPDPERVPSVMHVSVGDVDVQVSSSLSTAAIVDSVADAMLRGTHPKLTRAVQVAMGAR